MLVPSYPDRSVSLRGFCEGLCQWFLEIEDYCSEWVIVFHFLLGIHKELLKHSFSTQKLCWHFLSMTYLSLSWFLFFFLAFPKLQDTCYYSVVNLITLKPSVKTSVAMELPPPIFLLWEKLKDKIELLLVEKPHIEDISKLNFRFIFFPETSVVVQTGTVL